MTARICTLLTLSSLFLAGCSKITPQNYNQLKTGMSYESVEKILGKSADCTEILKTLSCIWGDDQKYIRGTFVAGKLVLYSSEGLE